MRNLKKIMAIALCLVLILSMAACAPKDKKLDTVRIGVHSNEGGVSLAAIAEEMGYFKEFGINPIFTIVDSGPAEMSSMRSDNNSLDVGYIGAGVAWNPIDSTGNSLEFIFLDCLSNAEMMLARDGMFVDTNNNKFFDLSEIFDGLKGKTVYMEVGTTPGGWFKDLLVKLNEGKPASEQLWIFCDVSSYLTGYEAPNTNAANKITVVNYANATLAAGMSSTNKDKVDIAVAYAPVTNAILKSNTSIVKIAGTDTHMADKYFPSTWVANSKWLTNNPDVAQRFVNALYKGLVYRSASDENLAKSMRAGEIMSTKPTNSFDSSAAVWPTKAQYTEWFKTKDAQGYKYMKSLYEAKKSGVPKGTTPKSFENSFNDKYILEAIKTVK